MMHLTDLADELLGIVVSYLDQTSLASLALVDHQCCGIAQETLFRNVNILADPILEAKLLVLLTCTLLRCPGLATKVRKFSIHNPYGEKWPTGVDSREGVSAAMRTISSVENPAHKKLLEPIKRVDEGVSQWRLGSRASEVRPWLAAALGLMPQLGHLDVIERMDGRVRFIPQSLLGHHASWLSDLSNILGLTSVQCLRIHGKNFHGAEWYGLPNLRRLELDCYQDFGSLVISPETEHTQPNLNLLHTLLVRCSAFHLLEPGGPRNFPWVRHEWYAPDNPFQSLRHYTVPKRLEVEIINVAKPRNVAHANFNPGHDDKRLCQELAIISEDNPMPASFETFFECLQDMGDNLDKVESFSICFAEHESIDDPISSVDYTTSLAFLTGAKELTIPQYAIMRWHLQTGDIRAGNNFAELLPRNIETLRVTKCDSMLPRSCWLEHLLNFRHTFPVLTKFVFVFRLDEAREQMKAYVRTDGLAKRLRDMGIECVVR
jgi:hypothetical protein